MKHKVKVEVTTYATSLHVFLEEKEIGLAYDGDNLYKAIKEIPIPDCVLDLKFECDGFNSTDWEIKVWVDGAKDPLFKREGSIVKRGNSSFREYIDIPNCKKEVNMKKLNYLLLILLLLPCMLISQSTFQDSEGKSSIVIQQGGIGQINITDANIKIGYLYYKTNNPFRFGIEVSGKAANGFAAIFEKGEVVPEAKMKLSFGYYELLKKSMEVISDDWLIFQVGYQRGNYKLFDPAKDYEYQIRKEKFDGFSAMAYYNMILKGSVLIGISLGFERQNNYQDLEKVEINNITIVYESDKTIRRISSTQELREGEYKESDHFLTNFDILWLPNFFSKRIGIDLFGRYDSTKDRKAFKPGVGIFILKKGVPTKVIGGITLEMVEKQLQIGLTAGINF